MSHNREDVDCSQVFRNKQGTVTSFSINCMRERNVLAVSVATTAAFQSILSPVHSQRCVQCDCTVVIFTCYFNRC
jgi:hypothetical protein